MNSARGLIGNMMANDCKRDNKFKKGSSFLNRGKISKTCMAADMVKGNKRKVKKELLEKTMVSTLGFMPSKNQIKKATKEIKKFTGKNSKISKIVDTTSDVVTDITKSDKKKLKELKKDRKQIIKQIREEGSTKELQNQLAEIDIEIQELKRTKEKYNYNSNQTNENDIIMGLGIIGAFIISFF